MSSKIVQGVRAIMTGDAYIGMASLFVFSSLPEHKSMFPIPHPLIKKPLTLQWVAWLFRESLYLAFLGTVIGI